MSESPPRLSAEAERLVTRAARLESEVGGLDVDTDIATRRRRENIIATALCERAESVESTVEVDANGVRARLYRPRIATRDVLVWFHGGGWCYGELGHYDAFACAFANRAECAVLSVDYRLAPEHPYPNAVEDCFAAMLWASAHFEQVVVGGDSAGGNLAAVMALKARDSQVSLALQLLVYPVLDSRVQSPYITNFVTRYANFLGKAGYGEHARRGIAEAWQRYIPEADRRTEPFASPSLAPSLAAVAPATIVLAEHDLLRGEGEAYAGLLRAQGVAAQVRVYPGQVHGFYRFVGTMDDATDAVCYSARAARSALK